MRQISDRKHKARKYYNCDMSHHLGDMMTYKEQQYYKKHDDPMRAMWAVLEYLEIENPTEELKDAIHSAFCFHYKIRKGEMYYREFLSDGGESWEFLCRADMKEAFSGLKCQYGEWPWIY